MRRIFRTGFIPTPDATKARFAATNYESLAESLWQPIDRRAFFHRLKWYPFQLSTNGCTGFSAAMCGSKAGRLAGKMTPKLSGAYLYSRINGGRDAGSNIGDAYTILMNHGCATEESCDIRKQKNFIYRDNTLQFDPEAARFKGFRAERCESLEQAAIGLQRGGILEFAVHVDRRGRFQRLDHDGVIDIVPGNGNHAVHADGMKKIAGEWCLDMQTWDTFYGDKSRGYVPLSYLDDVRYQEMWIMHALIDDPLDAHDPPAPVFK
jgi:hypothetical protein